MLSAQNVSECRADPCSAFSSWPMWVPCVRQVVGVHMVGPESAEIIQGVAIAMKCARLRGSSAVFCCVDPPRAAQARALLTPCLSSVLRQCVTVDRAPR